MIISHRHRFIFLKTMKTASSSIEIALSGVCGPDDVITPTRDDLAEQRAIAGQNYRLAHPLVPKRPWWKRALGRPERHYHPSIGYYEHIPAERVRVYVGDEIWRGYFKFAFVRNPWDRQVSFYFYKTRNDRERRSFETFMGQPKQAHVESREIYAMGDAVSVDFLGRYERLHEDFAAIQSRLGLAESVSLPLANASNKPAKTSYRTFYNDHTRALVASWYGREIGELGYTF